MLHAISLGKSVGQEIKFISVVVLKTTTSYMVDALLTLSSLRKFKVGFEQEDFGRKGRWSRMGQLKYQQVAGAKRSLEVGAYGNQSRGVHRNLNTFNPFIAAKLLSS